MSLPSRSYQHRSEKGRVGGWGEHGPTPKAVPASPAPPAQMIDAQPGSPKAQAGARSGSTSCTSLNPCSPERKDPSLKYCDLNSAIS